MVGLRGSWFTCFQLLLLSALVSSAQPSLSGTVRNAFTNVMLAGIDLDVFDTGGNAVTVTGDTTLADGSFQIILPGPGTYYLRADLATGAPLIDQYYNNSFLRSQATPISVPAIDTAVTGLNFALQPGFAITGRVTGDGTGLAGIDLDLYAGSGEFLGSYPARTNVDGTFLIGALPTGTYFVKADPDPLMGQFHIFRFFGGTQEITTATPIQISGASVTGITWSLPLGGIIRGSILSNTASPLPDIDLDIYDSLGNRLPYAAKSLADGSYAIGPVPAGLYKLRADPAMISGYAGMYYGGGSAPSSAASISVTLATETAGIDMHLVPGGWIEGGVRKASGAPVAGIDIDVFDSSGSRLYPTARTGVDGSYAIGPLPAGPVILRADPDLTAGVVRIYHPDADDFSAAIPVMVPEGLAAAGIDFSLPLAGWVEGTIRDISGSPVTGIDIDIFDTLGKRISLNAVSGIDGIYRIGPVPAGPVIIRADPGPTQGYAVRYFPASREAASASQVEVAPALGTTQIDFSIPPAGWLAGTIRDALGQPIPLIDLDLFDAATGSRVSRGATSAADGSFLIGPLELDSYLLRADPDPVSAHVRSYWPGADQISGAGAINLVAAAGVTGLDFTLVAGRSLAGRLFVPGGAPAQGVDLDIINLLNGRRLEQSTITDATGAWVLPPVPYGSYALRADALDSLPYLDTYYAGSAFVSGSTPVLVDAASPATSLDFSLLPYVIPQITRTDSSDPFLLVDSNAAIASFSVDAPSGSITEMRFLVGGAVAQTDTSSPFQLAASSLPKGSYLLTPQAVDIYGRKVSGNPVYIIHPQTRPDITAPLLVPVPDGTGRAVLAWGSVPGRTYSVHTATSPAGPWSLLQTATGDGATLVRWVPIPAGASLFVRIRQEN